MNKTNDWHWDSRIYYKFLQPLYALVAGNFKTFISKRWRNIFLEKSWDDIHCVTVVLYLFSFAHYRVLKEAFYIFSEQSCFEKVATYCTPSDSLFSSFLWKSYSATLLIYDCYVTGMEHEACITWHENIVIRENSTMFTMVTGEIKSLFHNVCWRKEDFWIFHNFSTYSLIYIVGNGEWGVIKIEVNNFLLFRFSNIVKCTGLAYF